MKKFLPIVLISALILTGCSTKSVPATETPTPTAPSVKVVAPTESYSLEDVAKHATQSDCRSIVNGKVYDLTSAFGKHPGGDKTLLMMCGKDATEGFEKKHGNSDKANV